MTNNKSMPLQQIPVTRLVEVIPLQAIKTISLNFQGQVHTIREVPASIFDAFVTQFMEEEDIINVNREVWNPFQRWRMINFLLDDKALEVQDGMLVEVEDNEPASIPQLPSGLPSEPATCLADVLQGKGYIGEIVQAFKIAMNSPSIPDESNENGEQ